MKKLILILILSFILGGCAARGTVLNKISMGADRILEDSMLISCEGATVASVFRYMEENEIDPSAYAEVCDWPDYIKRRLKENR